MPPAISLPDAFAHCEALTRAHYENFPVGSRLIPGHLRPHVCSIYAFARTADDFADEPGLEPGDRLQKLDEWTQNLNTCLHSPQGPIFTALAETIRTQNIPVSLLRDLLYAFRQDVLVQRHATFNHLLCYCRYSAVPVGRLILHLFGYRDATRIQHSDAICTALQLANFWQDVAVDYSRNRIYLPQEDLTRFSVPETDLKQGPASPAFKNLLVCQIQRTETLFLQGRPLPNLVTGRLKAELRLTWLGGMEILHKLRRNDYDVFENRPKLGKLDLLRLLLHTLFWKP
ncbi:MAG: squalene synthase HpnC [bacterium]|nr:squalene synthase HpnC [bacterium]